MNRTPVLDASRKAVRCTVCGRIVCYKMGPANGFVEIKCPKCSKISTVNLALRKSKSPVHFRRVKQYTFRIYT